jgi:DNA-directed RNA polymerase specialized sigma24 family protein
MIDEGEIKELLHQIALYEDMKAYRKLFDTFYLPLKRFSYSLVKSNEAAEEIVSDVFIKVWQIRNKLEEIENCKVYIFTIAKNFSLNYITKMG